MLYFLLCVFFQYFFLFFFFETFPKTIHMSLTSKTNASFSSHEPTKRWDSLKATSWNFVRIVSKKRQTKRSSKPYVVVRKKKPPPWNLHMTLLLKQTLSDTHSASQPWESITFGPEWAVSRDIEHKRIPEHFRKQDNYFCTSISSYWSITSIDYYVNLHNTKCKWWMFTQCLIHNTC